MRSIEEHNYLLIAAAAAARRAAMNAGAARRRHAIAALAGSLQEETEALIDKQRPANREPATIQRQL